MRKWRQVRDTAVLTLVLFQTAGCGGERVEIGAQAPSFQLQDQEGRWVDSDSFEGQVVVLNFWQTHCLPCLAEIPLLNALHRTEDVAVVGINLDEGETRSLRPFLRRHEMNYPVLLGNEEVFRRYNGFGIPYTLVLDRLQRVAHVYRGSIEERQIRDHLEKLLHG